MYAITGDGTLVYVGGGATSASRLTWLHQDGSEVVIPGAESRVLGVGAQAPDGSAPSQTAAARPCGRATVRRSSFAPSMGGRRRSGAGENAADTRFTLARARSPIDLGRAWLRPLDASQARSPIDTASSGKSAQAVWRPCIRGRDGRHAGPARAFRMAMNARSFPRRAGAGMLRLATASCT